MSIWASDKGTWATVWKVEQDGNRVKGRISTSEKDSRNEGKYINSNWFVVFAGAAKDKALGLNERDKIKITKMKITNTMSGENKKSYLNVAIFDYETQNNNNSSNNNQTENQGFYSISNDDELPF